MVRTHLPLMPSRGWLVALCAAMLAAWVGLLGEAWAVDAAMRERSADAPQPAGLPFVMRPGDVLVNAPLGVRKALPVAVVPSLLVSTSLGVLRTPPPLPARSISLISAALGVLRGSIIRDVTPEALGVGENVQLMTVIGRGLSGATSVMLEPSLDTQVVSFNVDATGTRIDAVVNVSAIAVSGLRRVRVLDAEGHRVVDAHPGAGMILLAADVPRIDSVSPNLLVQGENYALEIRGSNLRGLPFRNAHEFDEQPVVRITPVEGVVIGSAPLSNEEGTLVVVPIAINAAAPLDDRIVQVITASGTSTSVASPANILHLGAVTLRPLSPFVSAHIGVVRGPPASPLPRFLVSGVVGVAKGPAVTSLSPTSAAPGDTLRLRLTGHGLGGTTSIGITPAQGIDIDVDTLFVSANEVAVDVRIATDASLLARRVSALGTTTRADAPQLLQIRDAAPQLTALSPSFLVRDGTSQIFELQGVHLGQATTLHIVADTDLVIEEFTVVNDTLARLELRAAPQALLEPRIVIISSPSGSSASVPSPSNTIHIADRTQVVTPFVSPLLGVRRGTSNAPEIARSLYSPTLGVVKGAIALAVTPTRIARGTTTRITVQGRLFGSGDTAALLPAEGITVRNVAVAADGLSVAFDAEVAVDAATGLRRVALAAGVAPILFSPGEAALIEVSANVVTGPVAEPDTYAVITNMPLSIVQANGVLANDHDPAGGALYAVLRRLPAFGALSLSADGSFVYTPNEDFIGSDRFEYSAGSGALVGASTMVTLNVAQIHDAVDDAYATNDNQPLDVPAELGLLANDVIADGGSVTIELASQPSLGQITLAADGSFRYVPNGNAGSDRFLYRLVSEGVRSAAAQVAIVVNDLNQAPIALDDHYVVDRGRALVVPAPGVMRNDRDPDGDSLTARAVSDPLVGMLAFNASGGFTYTPPANFTGEARFIYEITDPRNLRAQATVTINVNDHLAPLPDAYSLDEGEVLFVDAPGILANDSIIAQGALRIAVVEPPKLGTVQIANDGSFVYRASDPNISGTDLFRYRLEDAAVTSYAVDVRLTIHAVNDPPRVIDDRYLTDENVGLSIAAPGVLANDGDIDSATLAARLLAPPAHGAAVVRPDGSFSYVPEVNYRGTDTFTYEAVDASGSATPGTVHVDVTQPPTATNDVFLVDVDTPLIIDDPGEGLLINDHDAPEDDGLVAIPGDPPAHGSVTLEADGTFVYVPDTGYVGIDTFTYQVSDGHSMSNFGNVTLAVGITSLPRANADEYTIDEDQELVVNAVDGVLANDTDADTPPENLHVFLVDYNDGLTVTLAPDGSFRARPGANFYGETRFVYQIYDGTSVSNGAVVRITVRPVNDGVVAVDDHYGVLRNTVFESNSRPITYNDRYDSDYPVNFDLVAAPLFGSVELNLQSGHFRYTPQQDFAGTDTFTYRVFQVDTGISDMAVVTLRTNGPPIANPDAYTVIEDTVQTVSPSPLANDSDPDGDPIRFVGASFHSYPYITLSVNDVVVPTITTVATTHHFYGTRVLRYYIEDGTARSYADVALTVTPVPEAPIVAADDYLTPRNTPLVVASSVQSVLHNDFDPDTREYPNGPIWEAAVGLDLLPISAQLVTQPTHGTLTFSPIGTFTYTPTTDYSGTDTFTYRASDASGRQSAPATVRIRVNTPPTAADDSYVVTEDVPLSVPASEGLLTNDTDIDDDVLEAVGAGAPCAPCNGRVEIRADGSFRYLPNANFNGLDEFFYTVRDGVAGADVGRVSLNVLPVNDAPYTQPDTYRTREDEILVAPEPQGILRNDREVDGERLVNAELIAPADHGEIVVTADGSFTYTAAVDFNGSDTFRYRVYDESGLWSEDDVEILVTPVNDAPSAHNDSYSTRKDEVLDIASEQGVLANDTDVDGPELRAALVGLPQHGEIELQPDGSFHYQPDGIFSGIDQFQYQVDDGLGAIAAAVATITVRPVDATVLITVEDDLFGFEGPTTTIAAPGVLANDRVEGATALNAMLIVPPETGAVQLSADGGFRYTAPDGFSGQDGFTYAASAGGVSELARVTLDVRTTTNVPPTAVGEQFGVLEDHLLDSRSSGSLLANDRDHEGATLTLVVEAPPQHGAFAAQDDGHFTYAPSQNFNGSDHIVYRVSDGERMSEPATATVSVFAQNDAPHALPDLYQSARDTLLTVAAGNGLLANDSDVDGDVLGVELVDAPEHGQVQVAVDGGFVYQPAAGHVGSDRFRYAAADASARDVAEVSLTISAGANHPPVAIGESFEIDEDSVLDSDDVGLLTANDSDPDGDPLLVAIIEMPAHGTLELNGPSFSYRPGANYAGTDAFRYTVSDGALASAPATAAIHMRALNDPPNAATDRYVVVQGQPLRVDALDGLLNNDSDVEGQVLAAQLGTDPSHGTLDLRADGSFDYTVAAGFIGRDEFSYRVSDGESSTIGRAIVDVTAALNQRPVAIGEVFAIAEDSVLDTRSLDSLLANDRDPEGLPLSLVVLAQPATGVLEILPEGHIRYVPARDAVGDVVIAYVVHDGVLESAPVEVRVTLLPINDPPEAQADLYIVAQEIAVVTMDAGGGVLENDRDADGDTLVADIVRSPQYGTLQLGLDGSFVYASVPPRPQRDTFRYRIRDPAGRTAEAEVEFDLGSLPVTDPIFKNGFESP